MTNGGASAAANIRLFWSLYVSGAPSLRREALSFSSGVRGALRRAGAGADDTGTGGAFARTGRSAVAHSVHRRTLRAFHCFDP
jgi:hypothetical protein